MPAAAELGQRAQLLVLVAPDEAHLLGLLLRVAPDRRHAVLGDAQQHELAAGADEMQRAPGPQRDHRLRVEAAAGRALLARRLDLAQDPVEAVDDGDDDREADEGPDERAP